MKKFQFFIFLILSSITFTSCNSGPALDEGSLKWGMDIEQVKAIENIENENNEYLLFNSQELYGLVGSLAFNFDDSKLINVKFTADSNTESIEPKDRYEQLKENIIAEYGDPDVEEIRSKSFLSGDRSYQVSEWITDTTLISLDYCLDDIEYNYAVLTFQSLEYANAHKEAESDTSTQSAGSSNTYKTSGQWALDTSYSFAVEVDSYSGDKYSAGTYKFKTTNTTMGEAPMYDIYIESAEYNSISQLGSIDYTVGGTGSYPISITLNKGDYVYIVPYTDLLYTPKGYLTFTLSE